MRLWCTLLVAWLVWAPPALAEEFFVLEGEQTKAPTGWIEFCKRLPEECVPDGSKVVPYVKLTPEVWQQLYDLNKHVNHTIRPMLDLEHYGEIDHWAYPNDGYGDCEDYVLLKRRMLARDGWPKSVLLIAVVADRSDNGHAVLVVRTNAVDFVLDNLTDDIIIWSRKDFKRYIKIQSQKDPNAWMSVRQDYAVGSLKHP